MPDVPHNLTEINRLIAIGRTIGRYYGELSGVKGNPAKFETIAEKLLDYVSHIDESIVKKKIEDAIEAARSANSVDESIHILEAAIVDARNYLDQLKAIYGKAPESDDFACAYGIFFTGGYFYYGDERLNLSGLPGQLLYAFLTSPNNYLTVNQIESFGSKTGTAVSRIGHLNEELLKSPIKKRCILRWDIPFPGYRLMLEQ